MGAKQVLVLGSTGTVGSRVAAEVRRRGAAARAATRSASGPEQVSFDQGDPATFDTALDGVDRAFLLSPSGRDASELVAFVERAERAGLDRLVVMTADGVEHAPESPLGQLERSARASSILSVILRPSFFMQNFETFWVEPIRRAGQIIVPAGQGRTPFIDADDIARAAAAALLDDGVEPGDYTLTGPEPLDHDEIAALLSEVGERTVKYEPLPDHDFFAMLTERVGLPTDYAQALLGLYRAVREGQMAAVHDGVQVLTGRAPGSARAWAERAADTWRVEEGA